MNPLDDQLDRLLRAAGQIPREAVTVPAFGLETRVLAAWRATSGLNPWSPRLLIRSLIVAGGVVLVSLLPLLQQASATNPAADYLQLADSTVQDRNP
jgi:hypothetical protein